MHCAAPPNENLPAGHTVQLPDPLRDLYVPPGHAVHAPPGTPPAVKPGRQPTVQFRLGSGAEATYWVFGRRAFVQGLHT